GGRPKTARVVVEENVFIGSNVTVLKGARIGRNSVIANGAVVTGRIPPNVIAAGMPARPIKRLNEV
ncbi:acyltransferase, partial [Candidatus Parcubacteria bacterium]